MAGDLAHVSEGEGVMEILELPTWREDTIYMGNERLYLTSIADVQYGEPGCYVDLFKQHVKERKALGAWAIGGGDYIDVASPSNRKKIRDAELYDSVRDGLENLATDLTKKFARMVDGLQWAGLVEGHHFWEHSDGETSDQKLARMLHTEFLGTCAFIRFRFKKGGSKRTCTVYVHHGRGSGKLVGSNLNLIQSIMLGHYADIYIVAHMHRSNSGGLPEIYMTRKKPYRLGHRVRKLVGAGSYLRGYLLGRKEGRVPRGSYVERAMMLPVELGSPIIEVTPLWKGDTPLQIRVTT